MKPLLIAPFSRSRRKGCNQNTIKYISLNRFNYIYTLQRIDLAPRRKSMGLGTDALEPPNTVPQLQFCRFKKGAVTKPTPEFLSLSSRSPLPIPAYSRFLPSH